MDAFLDDRISSIRSSLTMAPFVGGGSHPPVLYKRLSLCNVETLTLGDDVVSGQMPSAVTLRASRRVC